MNTPEYIAQTIIDKYGVDAFRASKRPRILTEEIRLAGHDPEDIRFRSKVTLALLPKRVSNAS